MDFRRYGPSFFFFHLFSVSFGERSSTCPVCAVLEPPNTVLCRGSTSKTCFVSRPLPAGVFCAVLRKLEQLFVRTLCAQTGAVAGMRHLCLWRADFATKPLARFGTKKKRTLSDLQRKIHHGWRIWAQTQWIRNWSTVVRPMGRNRLRIRGADLGTKRVRGQGPRHKTGF